MNRYRPIVLGMLNAAIPGLGYVFISHRRLFGWLLFVGTLLSFVARGNGFSNAAFLSQNKYAAVIELCSVILLTVAFGIDAYFQAKEE